MLITSLFWCSLFTSITNSNGLATVDVTLTATSTVYAYFGGVTGIPNVNSNTITITIEPPLYAPLLDGTETITTIQGTVTTGNGELISSSQGTGILADGWDNTGDWELTCELYIGGNFAMGITTETNRAEYNEIALWYSGNVSGLNKVIDGSSTETLRFSPNVPLNTWFTFTMRKTGTSMYYGANNQFVNTVWSKLSSEQMRIIVRNWGYHTNKVRNIVVNEIE